MSLALVNVHLLLPYEGTARAALRLSTASHASLIREGRRTRFSIHDVLLLQLQGGLTRAVAVSGNVHTAST